jgi:hypothetical protein
MEFSFLLGSKLKPSSLHTTELKGSLTIVCLYKKTPCIQIRNSLRSTPHDLKRELSYCEESLFQNHHVFRIFHRPSVGLSFLSAFASGNEFPSIFRRSLQSRKKKISATYCMCFLTYDWPWLHNFGNEIGYCSVAQSLQRLATGRTTKRSEFKSR